MKITQFPTRQPTLGGYGEPSIGQYPKDACKPTIGAILREIERPRAPLDKNYEGDGPARFPGVGGTYTSTTSMKGAAWGSTIYYVHLRKIIDILSSA